MSKSSIHTWSKDLDFDTEVIHLKKLVLENKGKRQAYFAILLTELSQSCRISEAIDALIQWAKQKGELDFVQVRVRKRKDVYWRDVFIPKTVLDDAGSIRRALNKLEFSDKLVDRLIHFSRYHLYNTHALRHAGITNQGESGVPDQVIAVGTGHKKVEHVRIYTQRSAARKILKDMAVRA